jgi:Flp pilus assembly protein TadD
LSANNRLLLQQLGSIGEPAALSPPPSRRNSLAQAEIDFTAAIAKKPDYSQAFQGRAEILVRKGDFQAALKDCNEALTLHPNDSQTHYQRGLIYLHLHIFEDAKADFKQAAKKSLCK